jgi:hypothetical protein
MVALLSLLLGATGCERILGPVGWGDYGFDFGNEYEWSVEMKVGNTDGWYSGDNMPYCYSGRVIFVPLPGQGEFPVKLWRVGKDRAGYWKQFTVDVPDGAPNPRYKLGHDGKVYKLDPAYAGSLGINSLADSSDSTWVEVPTIDLTEE